jgi:pyruvate dehydrogenase E2 component (dihydrolipoamide acetyltransferase)
MVHPVYVPRINNNDDEVRLTAVLVNPTEAVHVGRELAEVETEKATFVVEAERAGYVAGIAGAVGDTLTVGSVLLWLSDSPGEPAPGQGGAPPTDEAATANGQVVITAKAKLLLAEHGLEASAITASGGKISVADVEQYLAGNRGKATASAAREPAPAAEEMPAPGQAIPLTASERGMVRSVMWHRDEAAAAYLEITYDPKPWEEYAARYAEQNRLLSSPLLGLLKHHLARIAADHPRANSTLSGGRRYVYDVVNVGFTIQAGETLYLAVVRDVARMTPEAFLREFNRLHKQALRHKLEPADLQGATIGFSSMARWPVLRHIPILPPHVSLICAHTVALQGAASLGATYDHRVLSGADAYRILSRLAVPPGE